MELKASCGAARTLFSPGFIEIEQTQVVPSAKRKIPETTKYRYIEGRYTVFIAIWKSFAVSERIEEEAGKKIVKRIPRKKA